MVFAILLSLSKLKSNIAKVFLRSMKSAYDSKIGDFA